MHKLRRMVSWVAVAAFFVLLSSILFVFLPVLDSLPRPVAIAWGLAYMGSLLFGAVIAIRELAVNWRNLLRHLISALFVSAFVLFVAHYGQRIEHAGWGPVWPELAALAVMFLMPVLLAFGGMIVGLLIVSAWDEKRQRGDGAVALVLALMVALPLAWGRFALPWALARLPTLP